MNNRSNIYHQQGWFSIYRSLISSPLWLTEKFTRGQAWVDMIALANHADGFIRVRGNRVPVLRGQLGWSQIKLAQRWDWSRSKVSLFLNELEKDQKIEQQKDRVTTVISIVNYDYYQNIGQQTSNKKSSDVQQKDTNNNKNKENHSNNGNVKFSPPSLSDISIYFSELGGELVEPQKFADYYTANGWKIGKNPIKDWKATARNWITRTHAFNQNQKKGVPSTAKIELQKNYNEPL
jgi:hypothetical protein